MNYRPYSPEWHRKRYLKEAIDNYLNDYVDNEIICNDLLDILSERSNSAYNEFHKINDLENSLRKAF